MKSCFAMDICIFAVFMLFIYVGYSSAEPSKNRRAAGGNSGLYAFPRVGRSDPSLANGLHESDSLAYESMYPSSLDDYDGRNDVELRKWARLLALQQALDKRTGPSATSGLWFGPRLGKRSVAQHLHDAAQAQAGQKEQY